MNLRELFMDYSLGNNLGIYWRIYRLREHIKNRFIGDILTFFLNRTAHKRGGYIGRGAKIAGIPSLPHGLHGIYISRYAVIGRGCRIYQNVTIGEINGEAPQIDDGCLIGANAVLVGGIHVGSCAKIGAGAVVNTDIPAGATVVAQPSRIIIKNKAAPLV